MAEEIALENGRISNLEGLVTLTFDQVTMHTVVHHSIYIPNFMEIEKTFCGRKNTRMYARMHVCTHVWTDRHLRTALLG